MNNSKLEDSSKPQSQAPLGHAEGLWFSINPLAILVCSVTVFAVVACCGCSDETVTNDSATDSEMAETEVAGESRPTPTALTQQSDELPAAAQQESSGLMDKAGKLLSGAKQASGKQVEKTGEWIKGAWDGASDSTGNAVEGSLDWANQTFKTLKDQGLTTASSTGQWLNEDWQNMESWQYKVVAANSVPAEELETKLNELGKQGWECFSIDDQRMIFKKASESYLRRLPFKDILRLAPLLNQGK